MDKARIKVAMKDKVSVSVCDERDSLASQRFVGDGPGRDESVLTKFSLFFSGMLN